MDRKNKIIIGNILSVLIILLATVFMFKDVIVNRKIILGSDFNTEHYPYHTLYAEGLKQFKITLWNPYLGLGFPFYAEGQISALHPVNLASFFLFPAGIAMTVSLVLCTLFCAIFMYLYARRAGMGYSASIFCSFAFALGGNYIGIFTAAMPSAKTIMFFPLVLYCLERILKESNLKNIIFLSISFSLAIFGDHGQTTFLYY